MMKNTFIPNWYIDKKIKMKMKKIKICIVIALIVNIILISFILNVENKINNMDRVLGNQKGNTIGVKTLKHDIIIIEKYKKLCDFFKKNNLSYKNVIMTESNLEIDIEVENYDEYIHAISCLEYQYSIKKLTPNTKKKGKFNFKVILEV